MRPRSRTTKKSHHPTVTQNRAAPTWPMRGSTVGTVPTGDAAEAGAAASGGGHQPGWTAYGLGATGDAAGGATGSSRVGSATGNACVGRGTTNCSSGTPDAGAGPAGPGASLMATTYP